jgi:putative membrane protein
MAICLAVSAIDVQDSYTTWALESFPVWIALVILPATMKRFRLTNLLYVLILIHSIILVLGAHYSYTDVPLGFWIRDLIGGKRNNYDKIGHFMQGFGPAMIAREIISRCSPLKKGGWLGIFSWCVAMTLTALYEIFEMIVSCILHGTANAFLGTQGYVWDTQTDMLMCLVGATVALILLSKYHDHLISKLLEEEKEENLTLP